MEIGRMALVGHRTFLTYIAFVALPTPIVSLYTPCLVWLFLCIMLCVSFDGAYLCVQRGWTATALVIKLDPEPYKLLTSTARYLLAIYP